MVKQGESYFMSTINKTKTALIIGGNSMVGKQVVNYFSQNSWNLIATVSSKKKIPIAKGSNVEYNVINLESPKSIKKGIKKIHKKHPSIQVLINCAGIVLMGATEAFEEKQIRRQMKGNELGVVNTIQEVLPIMRKDKGGTIVSVSSLCGLVAFPMLSLYHGSKWALEGFSESLYYELEPLNIKVKLIEPGGIKHDGETSATEQPKVSIQDYDAIANNVNFNECFPAFSSAEQVAKLIYTAATDQSNQLRYTLGDEVIQMVTERQNCITDESFLTKMKKRVFNN